MQRLKQLCSLFQAVFNQRNKVWGNWQSAQTTLNKKREALAKFEIAGKADKVGPAQEEVKEVMIRLIDFNTFMVAAILML